MQTNSNQQIERDEENKQINTSLRRMSSSIQFSGFQIRIEDLITWIPKKKDQKEPQAILKGITTNIKKGKMTAIIGPSGSGKTTLMNFLAGRQNESQQFRNFAHYFLNNTEIFDISEYKNIIGYVLQEDLIEARLTPREVFRFYAKMRINKNQDKSDGDIDEKVNEMIELLGLEDCADTVVGDEFIRGISGGQKKRVNIGIELIQNPNLLFLDEPTTGLDSTTALTIMQTIEKLKRRGITIISTLHSPSSKILELFDQVIILCQGNLVYDGSPNDIIERLHELDFQPKGQPPLEYFLQIIDKDDLKIELLNSKNKLEFSDVDEAKQFEEEVQQKYEERIQQFTEYQAQKTQENINDQKELENQNNKNDELEKINIISKEKNLQRNVVYQFVALFWKSFRLQLLDYKGNLLRIFIILLNAVTVLITFLDLGKIEDGAIQAYQNRGGFIAMVLINLSFLGLNISSTIFIPLKRIFQKDQQGRIYGKIPFFFATIFNIYPFYLLIVFVEVTIFYYFSDLNKDSTEIYFWYLLFNLIIGFVNGTVLGILVGVIVPKKDDVPQVLPLLILPLFIVSGFFAQVKSMTWPLQILSYVSPTKFAFQGQIINEFRNSEQYLSKKACQLPEKAKQQCNPFSFYDFYEKEIWKNAVFGIGLFIAFLFISLIVFMVKYREKKARMMNNEQVIKKYAKINPQKLENI